MSLWLAWFRTRPVELSEAALPALPAQSARPTPLTPLAPPMHWTWIVLFFGMILLVFSYAESREDRVLSYALIITLISVGVNSGPCWGLATGVEESSSFLETFGNLLDSHGIMIILKRRWFYVFNIIMVWQEWEVEDSWQKITVEHTFSDIFKYIFICYLHGLLVMDKTASLVHIIDPCPYQHGFIFTSTSFHLTPDLCRTSHPCTFHK